MRDWLLIFKYWTTFLYVSSEFMIAWLVVTDFHPFALFFCFHPQCNAASACWFMLMTLPVPCCNPIGQIPSWLPHTNKLPTTTPENSLSLKRQRDPADDILLVHELSSLCIIQISYLSANQCLSYLHIQMSCERNKVMIFSMVKGGGL